MAITVEDGTIVANANSYASEAELTAYATARGVTLTAGTEQLLIQAMDYIEQQSFKGDKQTKDQSLVWPRYNVEIDGFWLDSDEIPQLLKDAQMEAAMAVDADTDPLANVEREVKKEKIDVIEVEYMEGTFSQVWVQRIDNKLQKLLKNGGGGLSVVAIRG